MDGSVLKLEGLETAAVADRAPKSSQVYTSRIAL